MSKRFPDNPPHPERVCWGCDRFCAVDSMACGNGSERAPHPAELFGPDWRLWGDGQGSLRHPQDGIPADSGPAPSQARCARPT